jgi:hypothetical protein
MRRYDSNLENVASQGGQTRPLRCRSQRVRCGAFAHADLASPDRLGKIARHCRALDHGASDPRSQPAGANLRRIINLSVVIVRACGRSSNHGKAGFGRAVPQRALRGLLDAPLEAGHDNPRGRRGKLKLARTGRSLGQVLPALRTGVR